MRRAKTREFPVAECKRCRRRLKIVSLERMICQTCHKHEPKAICGVCSLEKRFLTEGAGVCPDCVKKARRCTEVECARCGRTKPLAKLGGEYCKPCQTKVNRGEGRCSGCGKDKQYVLKKAKLCNRCYTIGYAPRGLQKNLETVSISNEYNRTLFSHLVGLIEGILLCDPVHLPIPVLLHIASQPVADQFLDDVKLGEIVRLGERACESLHDHWKLEKDGTLSFRAHQWRRNEMDDLLWLQEDLTSDVLALYDTHRPGRLETRIEQLVDWLRDLLHALLLQTTTLAHSRRDTR